MKIVIIDDKKEELARGMVAVRNAHHRPIICPVGNGSDAKYWMRTIEKSDGVITDLMFDCLSHKEWSAGKQYPAGLLVTIHALAHGKPVAICTRAHDFEFGHHSEEIGWIFDGYFDSADEVGWFEHKEWDKAVAWVIARKERYKK